MKNLRFIPSSCKAMMLVLAALAGISAAERMEAQCTLQVSIEYLSAGTNWQKCGFTGCAASHPTQCFLKSTAIETFSEYVNHTLPDCGLDPEGEPGCDFISSWDSESLCFTSTTTTDPNNNCAVSTNKSGTCSYDGAATDAYGQVYGPYPGSATWVAISNEWSDGSSVAPIPDLGVPSDYPEGETSVCTSTTSGTRTPISGTDTNYDSGGTDSYSGESDNITILSSEYTDGMLRSLLIANMPTMWATNASSSAYFHYIATTYNLASDHMAASGGKMQYRFHIAYCPFATSYKIKWDEVTTYDDTNQTPTISHMSETVPGNGDPTNGVYGSYHEVDVPSAPCTISENLQTPPGHIQTNSNPPGQ